MRIDRIYQSHRELPNTGILGACVIGMRACACLAICAVCLDIHRPSRSTANFRAIFSALQHNPSKCWINATTRPQLTMS
jgi:hypothetical protein